MKEKDYTKSGIESAEDLYKFLSAHDEQWIRMFMPTIDAWNTYLVEDDVRVICLMDENDAICAAAILDESTIDTVCFAENTTTREAFDLLFSEIERVIRACGYSWIYYGSGSYSFGLKISQHPALYAYLEQRGYTVEAAAYDFAASQEANVQTAGSMAGSAVLENVDQLKAQKMSNFWTVTGEYRSMSKKL